MKSLSLHAIVVSFLDLLASSALHLLPSSALHLLASSALHLLASSALHLLASSALFDTQLALAEQEVTNSYRQMREDLFAIDPDQLGLPPNQQVAAVLMETGYPDFVTGVVSVADGSASLYFSTGKRYIGAGKFAEPRRAAQAALTSATQSLYNLKPVISDTPLPMPGYVVFYVVTRGGVRTAVYREKDLADGEVKLSPLYKAGQEIITQVRVLDESRKKTLQAQGESEEGVMCETAS